MFQGTGLDVIWPQLLSLIAIGLVFFTFSLWRFRRSLR
jgi:ABC-2 type transport system permease protein